MVDVTPLGFRAALFTDEPEVAKAGKRMGLKPAVEVTEGFASELYPRRSMFWLFVGRPESVWAFMELVERRSGAGSPDWRGKAGRTRRASRVNGRG